MALTHGYGVVVGTVAKFERDPENDYGQYFHENVYVQTPAGQFHCAVDVDSKKLKNGVCWRVVPLEARVMKGVDQLSAGWHALTSTATSGALDYIRNADLQPREGCALGPLGRVIKFVLPPTYALPWKEGTSRDALADLEPLLKAAKRIWIFGEPFHDGTLGVHNIHQNQGDPIGSAWSSENGIWQDGATIVQTHDGEYVAFTNKFKTQSDQTDAQGRPIP